MASIFDVLGNLLNSGTRVESTSSANTNVSVNTQVNPAIVVDTAGIEDSVQKLVNTLNGIAEQEQQGAAAQAVVSLYNAEQQRKATIIAAVIAGGFLLWKKGR